MIFTVYVVQPLVLQDLLGGGSIVRIDREELRKQVLGGRAE